MLVGAGLWVALAVAAAAAAAGVQRVRHMLLWVRAHERIELDSLDELERETSTHEQACEILERCFRERTPFALYLRSFEPEAAESVATLDEPAAAEKARRVRSAVLDGRSPSAATAGFVASRERVLTRLGSPSVVDAYLADRLAAHLPVVAVLNPVATATPGGHVPRLELGHEDWALAVRLLISAAQLVVMECTVLAPGVREELDIIDNRRRAGRTVVVVPSAATARDLESSRNIGALVSATGAEPAPLATAGAPELAAFERRIADDELLAGDPAQLPAFAGLLPNTRHRQPAQQLAIKRAGRVPCSLRDLRGAGIDDEQEADDVNGELDALATSGASEQPAASLQRLARRSVDSSCDASGSEAGVDRRVHGLLRLLQGRAQVGRSLARGAGVDRRVHGPRFVVQEPYSRTLSLASWCPPTNVETPPLLFTYSSSSRLGL